MNDIFFEIIIPTYGKCQYLEEAINSVISQDYPKEKFVLTIVHDDAFKKDEYAYTYTVPLIEYETHEYDVSVKHMYLHEHKWNGGSRNEALVNPRLVHGRYILFLDHDDYIPNKNILKNLEEFIKENNFPDIIRLPYTKKYMSDGHTVTKAMPNETTLDDCINSIRVAPWTKCIKFEKLFRAPFPENTVFEDVCQHLKVCDICDTYTRFPQPVVEWRIWDGQTSAKKDKKWISSKWRFVADLMDLDLKKNETQQRRDTKVQLAIKDLLEDYKDVLGGKS